MKTRNTLYALWFAALIASSCFVVYLNANQTNRLISIFESKHQPIFDLLTPFLNSPKLEQSGSLFVEEWTEAYRSEMAKQGVLWLIVEDKNQLRHIIFDRTKANTSSYDWVFRMKFSSREYLSGDVLTQEGELTKFEAVRFPAEKNKNTSLIVEIAMPR